MTCGQAWHPQRNPNTLDHCCYITFHLLAPTAVYAWLDAHENTDLMSGDFDIKARDTNLEKRSGIEAQQHSVERVYGIDEAISKFPSNNLLLKKQFL